MLLFVRWSGGSNRVYRRPSARPQRAAARGVAAAACVLLMAGCAGAGTLARDSAAVPAHNAGAMKDGPLPDAIRADAAKRAGVPPEQVRLLGRDSVTWPDGGLGCPEPGLMYTQALVPGYRYRVQAGSAVIVYHASRKGAWVWCPPGRALDPLPSPDT